MKGEDLTGLEQTTQLSHKRSEAYGSRLYYKTIRCEKKTLPFVKLQDNPAVASPKEQLYEQMTSYAAFTERNIQKANAYLLDSCPEQISLVTYHTLRCLYACRFGLSTL